MIAQSERDGIWEIRLDHGKVNALDIEMCRALIAVLDTAKSEACAAVLLGNPRVFSAGIDLKRWLAEGPDYVLPFLHAMETVFRKIAEFPKPLVAGIQGPAVAGGCMMATACDFRFIAPTAMIGIPEMRVGVPLPMTAIEIVRFVATPNAFQRIVSGGAMYAGQEAVSVGLADQVVDADSLIEAAYQTARELLQVPPATFRMTKRQTRGPLFRTAEQNRERLGQEFHEIWLEDSTRQAVADYVRERL